MKTKLLITAFAAAAMLMGGTSTATAQGVRHRDMGGIKHKMERRFDNRHFDHRHPGPRHFDQRFAMAHRPAMGGVLYREVRTPNGFVYIVVGYI